MVHKTGFNNITEKEITILKKVVMVIYVASICHVHKIPINQ